MQCKTLKMNPTWRLVSDGGYSYYYKLKRKKGLKVLVSDVFTTKKALMNSFAFQEAMEEACLYQVARQRVGNLIPLCYGVVAVLWNRHWRPGILLEHIPGKLLRDVPCTGKHENAVCRRLYNKLWKSGIQHTDIAPRNVIVRAAGSKLKYCVIDFTPDFVYVAADEEEIA